MPLHEILNTLQSDYQGADQSSETAVSTVDAGLEGMIVPDKSVVGWFCGKNFHSV